MGTILEFTPPGSSTSLDDMIGHGLFESKPGQSTHDTTMALYLAESPIESGGFDLTDQMERRVPWLRKGNGQLAGAYHGEAIPAERRERLAMREVIGSYADRLCRDAVASGLPG